MSVKIYAKKRGRARGEEVQYIMIMLSIASKPGLFIPKRVGAAINPVVDWMGRCPEMTHTTGNPLVLRAGRQNISSLRILRLEITIENRPWYILKGNVI
jgi:hypothetical protein